MRITSAASAPAWLAALLATGSCTPGPCQEIAPPAGAVAAGPPMPLVLGVDEGERRVRRFGVSAPHFILKIDRRNGGSSDLVMGYEDLPPGGVIPPHRHLAAD